MSQPDVNAATVDHLVAVLRDAHNAESAATFPRDVGLVKQPGLYAWWVDADGLATIAASLGTPVGPLIYAGLAGATHWPSGKPSKTTLWSRVRGMHLRGNIRSSTFRQTLAAVLVAPLQLDVVGPNRVSRASEEDLSTWMAAHLRVTAGPYPDRETLGAMEQAILARSTRRSILRG